MPESEKGKPVAYVPFKTFLSAIEGLEHDMPHQIDTSVWPTYSGATKSQLLGSFKFLGLIDDTGRPTPVLKAVVEDKSNRKAHLRKIIETSYPKIIAVGLQKMTPKQFQDLIAEYGMEGETNKKVISFFLRAAKYAEIPMSNLLVRKARNVAIKRRRSNSQNFNEEQSNSFSEQQGTSRTIELKSGGTMTITISANVFDLDSNDRRFVFEMIDRLQQYQKDEIPNSR